MNEELLKAFPNLKTNGYFRATPVMIDGVLYTQDANGMLTAIDGEKIEDAGDLSRGINKKKDGDVALTVIHNKNQRTINVTPKDDPGPMPGAAPSGVRTIVIPRVEVGSIPEINVRIPRIDIPATPEINVDVPRKGPPPKRESSSGTPLPTGSPTKGV